MRRELVSSGGLRRSLPLTQGPLALGSPCVEPHAGDFTFETAYGVAQRASAIVSAAELPPISGMKSHFIPSGSSFTLRLPVNAGDTT